MSENFLALNPSKTEFILLGTGQQLDKLQNPVLALSSGIEITPVSSVRNLGAIFDKHLTLHDQKLVSSSSSPSSYQAISKF